MDAVVHYMRHGGREGRDPGPRFSSTGYLDQNPDVRQSGVNPLLHYLLRGRAEGRTGFEKDEVAALHREMDEVMARIDRQLALIELTEKGIDKES